MISSDKSPSQDATTILNTSENVLLDPLLTRILEYLSDHNFTIWVNKRWNRLAVDLRIKQHNNYWKGMVKRIFPSTLRGFELGFSSGTSIGKKINWKDAYIECVDNILAVQKDDSEIERWVEILRQRKYLEQLFEGNQINVFVQEVFGNLESNRNCNDFMNFINLSDINFSSDDSMFSFKDAEDTSDDSLPGLLNRLAHNRSDMFLTDFYKLISKASEKIPSVNKFYIKVLCNLDLSKEEKKSITHNPDKIGPAYEFFTATCNGGHLTPLLNLLEEFEYPLDHEGPLLYDCLKATSMFGDLEMVKVVWNHRHIIAPHLGSEIDLSPAAINAYRCGQMDIVAFLSNVNPEPKNLKGLVREIGFDYDAVKFLLEQSLFWHKIVCPLWAFKKVVNPSLIKYDRKIIELLLEKKFTPKYESENFLYHVLDEGDQETIQLVWNKSDDASKAETLFLIAGRKNNPALVSNLMRCIHSDAKEGKSISWINTTNDKDQSALAVATEMGQFSLVKLLLNFQNVNFRTVIDIAQAEVNGTACLVLCRLQAKRLEEQTKQHEKTENQLKDELAETKRLLEQERIKNTERAEDAKNSSLLGKRNWHQFFGQHRKRRRIELPNLEQYEINREANDINDPINPSV